VAKLRLDDLPKEERKKAEKGQAVAKGEIWIEAIPHRRLLDQQRQRHSEEVPHPILYGAPPYAFIVFYEWRLGSPCRGFNRDGTGDFPCFTLNSAHGDSVYVFSADAAGNLTGFCTGLSCSDCAGTQSSLSEKPQDTTRGEGLAGVPDCRCDLRILRMRPLE